MFFKYFTNFNVNGGNVNDAFMGFVV